MTNSPTLSGTWKVYERASGSTLYDGVTASNNRSTLTLSHRSDIRADTYYVTVTQSGEAESERAAVYVREYGTAYTVSGKITDAGTGVGLPATLQLKNSNGSNVGSAVYAASNGTYTIANVAPGNYTLTVAYSGYNSQTTASFNVSGNVTNKNLTLVKTITTYTVSGTVTDAGGKALPGVTVAVSVDNKSNTSGNDGKFSISGITAGSRVFTFSKTNYVTNTLTVNVPGGVNNANITLQEMTPQPPLSYNLTITVKGTLGGSANADITSIATIQLSGGGKNYNTFNITGLSAGTYDYTVSAQGHEEKSGSYEIKATDMTAEKTLNVELNPETPPEPPPEPSPETDSGTEQDSGLGSDTNL